MDARMIAHDMRTPLSALSLSLQLVRMNRKVPEEFERALDMAERNAKALAEIVDTLLAASASPDGKGGLLRSECSPLDLVTAAVDQIAPLAAHKGQSLGTGKLVALPTLKADRTRLTRVLVNLLSNAVKFAPDGGQIEVDAKHRLNDGHSSVVFSVIDDGPGVQPEHIDRIFLEGVSFANGSKYSSGLGLAVSKEIVEAHGGRIWAETGRKKGATFSFSIPTDREQ